MDEKVMLEHNRHVAAGQAIDDAQLVFFLYMYCQRFGVSLFM